MTNRIGDIVVKPRVSPILRYGLAVGGAVVAVLAGAGLFWRGESVAGFYAAKARRQESRAHRQISHLRHEVGTLSDRLAMSKRLLQSANAAYAALGAALKRSDQKTMQLRERLGFYQTILGASKRAHGVSVEAFRVVPDSKGWRYHLVLVQQFALNRWVYATVHVTVQGGRGSHSSAASGPGLVDISRTVHFKYFDDLRGSLALPGGFVPRQVVVQVDSGGHTLTRRYPWPGPSPSVSRTRG